jgi:hypothetical protein
MTRQHYPTLQPFATGPNETIDQIVQHAVEGLCGLERKALIQLRVIEAGAAGTLTTHSIELTPSGISTNPENVANPALVIITTADTLRRLADGSYSPIAAYLEGKVGLRGDVGLAGQIIQKLGAGSPSAGGGPSGGGSYVCPYLTDPQWDDPPGNQYGSFTITGIWFTPGGLVELQFFYQNSPSLAPGVPVPQFTVTNSEGQFSFTLSDVQCGDLLGENYGIAVVAIDLTTGKQTNSNYSLDGGVITPAEYSTPCYGPPPTSANYVGYLR